MLSPGGARTHDRGQLLKLFQIKLNAREESPRCKVGIQISGHKDMDPGGETQTAQHRQNIVLKDVISLSWPGDRLEGDGPLAVEAGVDDLEELGLLHEVPLDALVDRPVVAGPVLGHHADDEAIRWEKERTQGFMDIRIWTNP